MGRALPLGGSAGVISKEGSAVGFQKSVGAAHDFAVVFNKLCSATVYYNCVRQLVFWKTVLQLCFAIVCYKHGLITCVAIVWCICVVQ